MAKKNSNVQTLKQVMTELKGEIKILVQKILMDYDLQKNDNIVKQVRVQPKKDTLEIYLNSYIQFIQSGRRKFSRRVPVSALIRFIKKRNIPLNGMKISRVAYMIQSAIFRNGIKGKPGIEENVTEIVGDYIVDYIIDTFNVDIDENVVVVKRK